MICLHPSSQWKNSDVLCSRMWHAQEPGFKPQPERVSNNSYVHDDQEMMPGRKKRARQW